MTKCSFSLSTSKVFRDSLEQIQHDLFLILEDHKRIEDEEILARLNLAILVLGGIANAFETVD